MASRIRPIIAVSKADARMDSPTGESSMISCDSCGSEDYTVLTRHPSGGLLIECDACHWRWVER
jgi:hypothetical protein